MTDLQVETPANGSRIVKHESEVVLLGLPPDIVKGLLSSSIFSFDTIVLPDIRERDGSLLNHLEFPLYFFLFVAKGFAENRKLNLVGDPAALSQALRLLRITLTGPTRSELESWDTDPALKDEWLAVSRDLALKNDQDEMLSVDQFFNLLPFQQDRVQTGHLGITRLAADRFKVTSVSAGVEVDLNQDHIIEPPYPVVSDYVPGGLSKFGIEVLGGASGFSTTEPCTGLAMCYDGEYLLIDSIPFLDHHLLARGISKNQVSAVFLTHLHDDHCSMFPLMLTPRKVELITTRQIFNMAMDKLACGLGWQIEAVAEHFTLIEVNPGDTLNYYGLNIEVHNTVHSVPTIGATFSTLHKGKLRNVCIIGDNHSMSRSRQMKNAGIVRASTFDNLSRLYRQRFNLLIADGGAGDIHGDPNDALESDADRVVFVHVEEVPDVLKSTFSVVSSGKRYTLMEGGHEIYTAQVNRFLARWLGKPVPNRWLSNLLIEQEVLRYNADDVIIVQESESRGDVYLILTGYCEVVRVDNGQRQQIAQLQAGDVIGEMAVLTGSGVRNASVIARSPVTVCVFEETTFKNFIQHSGFFDMLQRCWELRPLIKSLPRFDTISPNVVDRIARISRVIKLSEDEVLDTETRCFDLIASGKVDAETDDGLLQLQAGNELGWRPFANEINARITARGDCTLIRIAASEYENLMLQSPQLNYQTRKYSAAQADTDCDWLLGEVPVYDQ